MLYCSVINLTMFRLFLCLYFYIIIYFCFWSLENSKFEHVILCKLIISIHIIVKTWEKRKFLLVSWFLLNNSCMLVLLISVLCMMLIIEFFFKFLCEITDIFSRYLVDLLIICFVLFAFSTVWNFTAQIFRKLLVLETKLHKPCKPWYVD